MRRDTHRWFARRSAKGSPYSRAVARLSSSRSSAGCTPETWRTAYSSARAGSRDGPVPVKLNENIFEKEREGELIIKQKPFRRQSVRRAARDSASTRAPDGSSGRTPNGRVPSQNALKTPQSGPKSMQNWNYSLLHDIKYWILKEWIWLKKMKIRKIVHLSLSEWDGSELLRELEVLGELVEVGGRIGALREHKHQRRRRRRLLEDCRELHRLQPGIRAQVT